MGKTLYNINRNNSESYCAFVLNTFKYKGKSKYRKADIWKMIFFKGEYISRCKWINTYIWIFLYLIVVICVIILCVI